jgi:hypothetical protein
MFTLGGSEVSCLKRIVRLWPYALILISLSGLDWLTRSWVPPARVPDSNNIVSKRWEKKESLAQLFGPLHPRRKPRS